MLMESAMEPVESAVEPIFQVSEALRITEDMLEASSEVLINKHQCESLAKRLHAMCEKLKELPEEVFGNKLCSDAANNLMIYPAFDSLLTILRKAQALQLKYTESAASIPSVMIRTEDREAFKEIHAELDMFNSLFHFENFEYTSESDKIARLSGDADEDLKEMSERLDGLAIAAESRQAAKIVVSEKSEGTCTSDGLPSFLNIDPANVEIKEEVRVAVRLSKHDPVETDGWARVRFGRYLDCEFALKVFKSGNKTWNRSELLKEVCSLMKLHHPHIVQLMGFAQDEEECIILMELMDTDLRHFMNQRSPQGKRPFTEAVEMDIITQIARGMYYLHEQQYVHGELKCSNILVKKIGDHYDVKISDLRSSQRLGVWDPVLFKASCTRRRPRWTAPELESYGDSQEPTHELLKKMDVYSFGMVCYEVVTGKLPFQDIRGNDLMSRIKKGDLKQELPRELDEKLRGLIESCWARDPNARPTFEVICHQLDYIRSSQPAFTKISSGIATVLRRCVKWISWILRLAGTETGMSNLRPADSSGENTNEEEIMDSGESADSSSGLTNEQQIMDSGVTLEANVADALPEFVRIDPANLKTGALLGTGASAKVYKAVWLGCKFAVKTFNVPIPSIKILQKELTFLIELRHPCIVRLMGLAVEHSECRCSIVMEFMGSSLGKLIKSRMKQQRKRKLGQQPALPLVPFDLKEAVHIISKIALGMAYLHSRKVAHRDLKADNVLVPEHSGSIDVKITDFGVSHLIDSCEKPMPVEGTLFWRDPEMFRDPPADNSGGVGDQRLSYDLKAADVFSFAMTCYEVLTGEVPLEDQIKNNRAGKLAVLGGLRPTLPSHGIPNDLKLLVEECWDVNPEKRPTFSTICQKLQKIQQELNH